LTCRTSAPAVTMLLASCISAAAQDHAGREKLRAQSNEFRKEVIRVTDGVYVAVGYAASNVMLIAHALMDGASVRRAQDRREDSIRASASRLARSRPIVAIARVFPPRRYSTEQSCASSEPSIATSSQRSA
jgi:hypothetical protein